MSEFLLFLMLSMNPQCSAVQHEFFGWSDPGNGAIETSPVPSGKIWLVRAAGLHTSYPNPAIWSIELKHIVWAEGGICCHNIVLERSDWRSGTPPLSLSRPIIMYQGDSLSARMCCIEPGYQIGIDALFYEVPENCLPVNYRG